MWQYGQSASFEYIGRLHLYLHLLPSSMDVARFGTLAAASDALRQEIDLLEEVVSPYKRMLSEVARKGGVSKIGRAPHVVMLVDNPDAYKIIAASRLRQAAAEEVIEWVQKEVWTIVGRNYGHVMFSL